MPSTLDDILTAVANTIVGLALEYDGAAVPVDVTKGVFHRDALDDDIRISVFKSKRPERYTRWSFQKKRVDYYVEVAIQAPKRDPGTVFDPDKDLADHTDFRQRVMDAFDRPPLAGAADVYEMTAEPLDFLDVNKASLMWELQGVLVTASIAKPY